jgi:hypothetical protein
VLASGGRGDRGDSTSRKRAGDDDHDLRDHHDDCGSDHDGRGVPMRDHYDRGSDHDDCRSRADYDDRASDHDDCRSRADYDDCGSRADYDDRGSDHDDYRSRADYDDYRSRADYDDYRSRADYDDYRSRADHDDRGSDHDDRGSDHDHPGFPGASDGGHPATRGSGRAAGRRGRTERRSRRHRRRSRESAGRAVVALHREQPDAVGDRRRADDCDRWRRAADHSSQKPDVTGATKDTTQSDTRCGVGGGLELTPTPADAGHASGEVRFSGTLRSIHGIHPALECEELECPRYGSTDELGRVQRKGGLPRHASGEQDGCIVQAEPQ